MTIEELPASYYHHFFSSRSSAVSTEGACEVFSAMRHPIWLAPLLLGHCAAFVNADDPATAIELLRPGSGVSAFRAPTGTWIEVGAVSLNQNDTKHLKSNQGQGIIVNDPPGKTLNLISKKEFGDVEVHLEFQVPQGSNSGIKLMGLYEIQIFDSFGKEALTGSDNGGVYPRAELLPSYHHIDEGYAPRLNASRAPGEWQELDIVFKAPKFDDHGKKIRNARFERVALNQKVVHEHLEVPYPTGHAWDMKPELASGPIMLQADHGPVAFRALRVKPLETRSFSSN
jgi:3-keto-disaccharide hydrolase